MSKQHDKILEIIQGHYRDNPITSAEIAERLKIEDSTAWPKTRRLILETMGFKRIAIGACRKGYYLISSETELNEYTQDLASRAEEITGRIELVHNCYYERNGADNETNL